MRVAKERIHRSDPALRIQVLECRQLAAQGLEVLGRLTYEQRKVLRGVDRRQGYASPRTCSTLAILSKRRRRGIVDTTSERTRKRTSRTSMAAVRRTTSNAAVDQTLPS